MLVKLILLQFIAYLLSEYVFTPKGWLDTNPEKLNWRLLAGHGVVIFLISWVMSLDFGFLLWSLSIALLFILTDVLTNYLQVRTKGKPSSYFFVNQLAKIVVLLLASYHYYLYSQVNLVLNPSFKVLAVIAGFLFCARPANVLIKNILIAFAIPIPEVGVHEDENKDLPNAGKLIGIVERWLTLALILVHQFSIVGFLLAAKSILRFRDNEKNEYVLVGTMLSFGIAILVGILISMT